MGSCPEHAALRWAGYPDRWQQREELAKERGRPHFVADDKKSVDKFHRKIGRKDFLSNDKQHGIMTTAVLAMLGGVGAGTISLLSEKPWGHTMASSYEADAKPESPTVAAPGDRHASLTGRTEAPTNDSSS